MAEHKAGRRLAIGLDHVGFAVRQLPPLLACMRRLGFTATEPRPLMGVDPGTGRSRPLGQDSAHLVLQQGYIELTAVPDPLADNHLEPYISHYEGLHILALHADDPAQARSSLVDAGVPVTPLADASRPIEYGDQTGDARFTWCMIEPDAFDAGLLCVMRGHTPELVYQRAAQQHRNSAFALRGVTLLSAEPERNAAKLACLTGQPPRRADGAWVVPVKGGELRMWSIGDAPDLHASTAAGRSPCMSGLTIVVRDLGLLQNVLEKQQVEFLRQRDSLVVISAEAGNAVLEFVAPNP